MSGSVNKVILIGNLGRDPEVRNFQSGGKVVNLRIATSETWRDKATGERKERTEWHSVAIFNESLAKIAEQYLRKGSIVYIEGALETRKWQDQSGQERYTTEVVLRQFNGALTLLGGRRDGDDAEGDGGGYDAPADPVPHAASRAPARAGAGAPRGRFTPPDMDDEISFAPEWRA